MADSSAPASKKIITLASSVADDICSPWRIFVLLMITFLQNLLVGGMLFGWGSFLVVLKSQGTYQWLCEDGAQCTDQDRALALMLLAGTVCGAAGSLPFGLVLDALGPKKCTLAAFACFSVGCASLAISSRELDLYVPAYALMGLAAPGLLISTFHMSALLPGRSGFIMAIINGCYDASAGVMQVFLWVVGDGDNTSLSTVLWIYLGAVVLPLACAVAFMVPNESFKRATTTSSTTASISATPCRPSLWTQLCTVDWIMFTCFFSGMLLRFSYYLGGLQLSLAVLSDSEDEVNSSLETFGTMLPFGLLVTPLVGHAIDSVSQTNAILLALGMALLHSVCTLLPSIELQVLAYASFVLFRSVFFSVLTTHAVLNFPPLLLGRLFGIASLVAAAVSTVQYGLIELGIHLGNFGVPGIVLLALNACSGLPLYVCMRWRAPLRGRSSNAAVAPEHAVHKPVVLAHTSVEGRIGK